jgi:hypothetical protein
MTTLTVNEVIERISGLLGCDPEIWDIECAIISMVDETDRARKTIGELRSTVACMEADAEESYKWESTARRLASNCGYENSDYLSPDSE